MSFQKKARRRSVWSSCSAGMTFEAWEERLLNNWVCFEWWQCLFGHNMCIIHGCYGRTWGLSMCVYRIFSCMHNGKTCCYYSSCCTIQIFIHWPRRHRGEFRTALDFCQHIEVECVLLSIKQWRQAGERTATSCCLHPSWTASLQKNTCKKEHAQKKCVDGKRQWILVERPEWMNWTASCRQILT